MRITMVYGALASGVEVTRMLDGRRRRLVISCGWRQEPGEVWQLAASYLDDAERAELAEALGLRLPDHQGGAP